jgi:glycosyltransferase involved in cell wall biosynthesis
VKAASRSVRISFVTRNVELGALLYGNRRFAAKALEQGYGVDFVGLEGIDPTASATLPEGSQTHALGLRRFRQGPFLLARYFREQKPTVVFVSGYVEGLCCALAARMMRRPPRIVVRSHVVSSHFLAIQDRFFDRTVLRFAMRRFFRPPVKIHAVSDDGARDFEALLGYPRGSVATLYDPVLPAANRIDGKFEHPWFAEPGLNLLLAVGRLESQKDFPTLIRAFATVHAKDSRARLLILGEGSERAKLSSMVEELSLGEFVDMPGFVGDPETAYRHATLFICSSAYEGLCNVIVEALAAGCPVVSTDCPVGPAEVLERGRHGQLVPVGDAGALAQAVLRAPSLAFDKEAAKRRAMDFHIDNVWPQFAKLAGLTPCGQPSTSSR